MNAVRECKMLPEDRSQSEVQDIIKLNDLELQNVDPNLNSSSKYDVDVVLESKPKARLTRTIPEV
jgi:hypothetical protein